MWSVFKDISIPEWQQQSYRMASAQSLLEYWLVLLHKKLRWSIKKWILCLPQAVVEFIQTRLNLKSNDCSRVKYHPLQNSAELWQYNPKKIIYDITIHTLLMSIHLPWARHHYQIYPDLYINTYSLYLHFILLLPCPKEHPPTSAILNVHLLTH